MKPVRSFLVTALFALLLPGCGDNQDPEGAEELWSRIHDLDYRSFARAPGYESRRDSDAPHGGAVDIYVNAVVASSLAGETALSAWPDGSRIVKDGWDGDDLALVAVMEKRGSSWYWAEYDAEGSADYSGSPDLCIDCHASGDDYVRAFGLPK